MNTQLFGKILRVSRSRERAIFDALNALRFLESDQLVRRAARNELHKRNA